VRHHRNRAATGTVGEHRPPRSSSAPERIGAARQRGYGGRRSRASADDVVSTVCLAFALPPDEARTIREPERDRVCVVEADTETQARHASQYEAAWSSRSRRMTDATLRRRDGAIQSPRLIVALGSRRRARPPARVGLSNSRSRPTLETHPRLVTDKMKAEAFASWDANVIRSFKPSNRLAASAALVSSAVGHECPHRLLGKQQ
jgi:hypothetical protein